jgi:hypothetical protein
LEKPGNKVGFKTWTGIISTTLFISFIVILLQWMGYFSAPAIEPIPDLLKRKISCISAIKDYNITYSIEILTGAVIVFLLSYSFLESKRKRRMLTAILITIVYLFLTVLMLTYFSFDYYDRNMKY